LTVLKLYRSRDRYGWSLLPVVYLLPMLPCYLLLTSILPIGKNFAATAKETA